MRSLWQSRHERGRFLHLRALWCKLLGRKPGHPKFFPQPGVTYAFEDPDCADAEVDTARSTPKEVAEEIVRALGFSS
jgi:hypothetical protein